MPFGWIAQPKTDKDSDDSAREFSVAIPADAIAPVSPADAIEPEHAPLISARLTAELGGYSFAAGASGGVAANQFHSRRYCIPDVDSSRHIDD